MDLAHIAGFKDGERKTQTKKCRLLLENEKSKEIDFPLQSLERMPIPCEYPFGSLIPRILR